MTVKELIKELEKMPPNAEVVIFDELPTTPTNVYIEEDLDGKVVIE